ncbi:DUF6503 family protein [Flagellimonas meridianipacifica]|uniref:Uncharacterized protein n=1 Tax=Flagellimonas meridianipacifica TaxID=1080225 RepID=A0A2T0M9Q2_9FLAO|nr:DUF6503 family protein [Allomuricauda pacifica]PRX54195.1 hypothetical protein CLV81_2592 [Allomuricauda pacifica]
MRKIGIVVLILAIAACKPAPKKEEVKEEIVEIEKPKYPEALGKVLERHGGMDAWRQKRTMTYALQKPNFKEVHTIDLYSRKDRIDTEIFSMGFDGEQAWLLDTEKKYTGNVGFYHNLIFYFYAMPFVLADEGIIYGDTEDLEFEGKNYPGIEISYESGVGASSKDQYFIHYDPDTNEMAWLGYTVTYRSGEVSDNVKWIRYDDWTDINGVVLPNSISWYKYEGRTLLEPANTLTFESVSLSTDAKEADFYEKPEGAEFVEIKKN